MLTTSSLAEISDREIDADTSNGEVNPPKPMLQARRAGADGEAIDVPYFDNVEITVDGHIDESVWSEVAGYDAMLVIEPDTLGQPEYQTISRFLYTSEGLYVAAFMERPPETLISRLSSRDKYINRDSYGLTLDT
ncbi:MAG: hypothetical protein O7F71_06680, partial [Gammaproteobacteria bacterium]|nr:hypothetical protein [Gammaproteobacteria bacterium]